MLVITRRVGAEFIVGDDIRVKVLSVSGGNVRIGVVAPRSTPVHRLEVYKRVKRSCGQNQAGRRIFAEAALTTDQAMVDACG